MKDLRRFEEIWAAYVYEGRLDSSVQPAVAECWRKCREAGVDPNGGIGRRVDDAVFRSIREANSTLMEIALTIMQSVFDIVRRTGFLMVLTDRYTCMAANSAIWAWSLRNGKMKKEAERRFYGFF